MKRLVIAITGIVLVVSADPAASRGGTNGVEIKSIAYEFEQMIPADNLDYAMMMTLLDLEWLPTKVSAGHVVAEATFGFKHHVKVDITYNENGMLVKPLSIGKSIDFGKCVPFKGNVKVPCVHRNYYVWLEQIVARLPKSAAKISLIRSLNSPSP